MMEGEGRGFEGKEVGRMKRGETDNREGASRRE